MRRLLAGLILGLLVPVPAMADTIAGIVSERSAAELAAGAHHLLEEYPDHEVRLRTPEQLADKSDAEVAAFWEDADAVLIAAVFQEEAGRLVRLLDEQGPDPEVPVIAVNSDRDLSRRSRLDGERILEGFDHEQMDALTANPDPGEDALAHLRERQEEFPEQAAYLEARAFYQGRTPDSMGGLMRWLLAEAGHDLEVPDPDPRETLRWYRDGNSVADPDELELDEGPAVALLDLDTGDRPGDRDLLDESCQALEARGIQCFAVLARWGGGSVEAVETLAEAAEPAELTGVLSLQDFTVGGGTGREAVSEALAELDVPAIKGVRLSDRTQAEWELSEEGIPWDSVHYQLAMPELQGISQPMVLAVADEPEIDSATGIELKLSRPVEERVTAMAERLERWQRLRDKANEDKRVAVVYYNHPPGRHNIGADKLDVPESLFEILQRMDAAGYEVGELPEDAEALHERIQEQAVNLPEDELALEELSGRVPSLDADAYQEYFETLPEQIQAELEEGPVGYIQSGLEQAVDGGHRDLADTVLENGVADLRHLVENHEHAAQQRALELLTAWEQEWQAILEGTGKLEEAEELAAALIRTGIPGLSGWGEAPGEAMVHDDEMLFPGIEQGNLVLAPQPPRGWEVRESLLHANTSFPPTHQYVGFYHWLRDHFEADAIVYVGRHSTREFLPRRRAGLAGDDYPELLGGDLPVIYPYIVDGVGEGIQAKRRAMGVIVSHLTPPLEATELYDELLELRQLVETHEAGADPDSPTRRQAAETLRDRIEALDLTAEIEREIADELGVAVSEVELDEVDEDLLVHEAGHYVTHMQEHFLPAGLHIFGRDWDDSAVDTMVESMLGDDASEEEQAQAEEWRDKLARSPGEEMAHLLGGLEGRFVPPGQGNDPIRTPEVLPTGRNFHALAGDLIPTRVAWDIGQEMAGEARERGDPEADGSEAVVLWASDTVRDEGVMVAFGLDMLGVKPEWNSRGIVEGIERQPLDEESAEEADERRDVLFTTSGLFRDLYEDQLTLLDRAVRVALDGATETIREQYPDLEDSLEAALAPLPGEYRDPGEESLEANRVAQRWVDDTRRRMDQGAGPEQAGGDAILRIFGTAPGAYGAGVNRLAERSGAWDERGELADAYVRRMGHAWGGEDGGSPAHEAFGDRLESVGRTYLGRASHVYGLLDNDDGFDFQGGLSAAVEQATGSAPDNRVLDHADPEDPQVESLERALLGELRARNLNPQWIAPLMEHGYAGARTMSADFLDNLWGWQATSPEVVQSWAWDEVHEVYFEDRHELGVDEFLAEEPNVHVKTHMQAIMLVAAHREFWEADAELLEELAADFAELVVEHGLPGSGHTRPDHPTMDWVAEQVDEDLAEDFDAVREAALVEHQEPETDPARVAEIDVVEEDAPEAEDEQTEDELVEDEQAEQELEEPADTETGALPWLQVLIGLALLLLLAGGFWYGRGPGRSS